MYHVHVCFFSPRYNGDMFGESNRCDYRRVRWMYLVYFVWFHQWNLNVPPRARVLSNSVPVTNNINGIMEDITMTRGTGIVWWWICRRQFLVFGRSASSTLFLGEVPSLDLERGSASTTNFGRSAVYYFLPIRTSRSPIISNTYIPMVIH